MEYVLPEKAYKVMKWAGLIFFPALATFIGKVGPGWGLPNCDQIVLTVNATGLFIGSVIGASQLTAKDADD